MRTDGAYHEKTPRGKQKERTELPYAKNAVDLQRLLPFAVKRESPSTCLCLPRHYETNLILTR
jgi:hypothetical protein